MSDTKLLARYRQVALLGSSGDIATEAELGAAAACGIAMAARGLTVVTAGDDGVMGAAVRAAKEHGGTAVAIVPREKELFEPWWFDSIVDTGLSWVQFADALARSCGGALIVGGGAGTLAEIVVWYLGQLPAAFVGSGSHLAQSYGGRPLDTRVLAVIPVFDEPLYALDHIQQQFQKMMSASVTASLQKGLDRHFQSYPYGTEGAFLESAERFHEAMVAAASQNNRSQLVDAAARYADALGDHFYYHVDDCLQAAAHYARAARALSSEEGVTKGDSFDVYLRAIMIESLALGLCQTGEFDLASRLAREAAHRYGMALKVTPEEEHRYLRHSIAGLEGFAAYAEARYYAEAGRTTDAVAALEASRRSYEAALALHSAWRLGCSHDSYSHAMSRIKALEATLNEVQEARS